MAAGLQDARVDRRSLSGDEVAWMVVGVSVLLVAGFGVWWVLGGNPRANSGSVSAPMSVRATSTSSARTVPVSPNDDVAERESTLSLERRVKAAKAPALPAPDMAPTNVEESVGEPAAFEALAEDAELAEFDDNARRFDERLAAFDQELSEGKFDEDLSESFRVSFQGALDQFEDLGANVVSRCTESVCEVEIQSEVPTGVLLGRSVSAYGQLTGYASGALRSYDEGKQAPEVMEEGARFLVEAQVVRTFSERHALRPSEVTQNEIVENEP